MRNKIPQRDLSQRLHGTVNRYNGTPYYFEYLGGDGFQLQELDTGRPGPVVNAYDEGIDISSPDLGYCQTSETTVTYVTRRPQRIYKQGLTQDVLITRAHSAIARNMGVRLRSKEMKDMLTGNYRTVEDYFNRINQRPNDAYEQCITREIALRYSPDLRLTYVYYKGDDVGVMLEGTRTIRVPSTDKGWLVSMFLQGFNWEVE